MDTLAKLGAAVETGNRDETKLLTEALLAAGLLPQDIVNGTLIPAMGRVGEKFKNQEIFVPEMIIAARAMKQAMTVLEPLLVKAGIKPKHTAVIGTVQGDLHDIGKNLVAMMWKGSNFAIVDLGVNVPPEKFVAATKEHNAQIVGISALLTTTMPAMKTTVDALRAAGLDTVKIVVGGAPLTQSLAEEMGADGYGPDAAGAVDVARALLVA